jgi:hypothetical protein
VILTCISLVIINVEHFFHIVVGHLYILSCKMSIQVILPVFNWIIWGSLLLLLFAVELFESIM